MKKIMLMLGVALMLIGFSACSSKEVDEVEEKDETTLVENTTETSTEISTETSNEVSQEVEEASSEEASSEVEEDEENNTSDFGNLQGQDLYNALMPVLLENIDKASYQMEMVSSQYDGSKVTSVTTVSNGNSRVETQNPEGIGVIIYNAEEQTTYAYDEASMTGMIMPDDEEEAYDNEELMDEEDSLISAELDEFLGREVIKVVYDYSYEGVTSESEMWMDVETGASLKSIMRDNGVVVYEVEATRFVDDFEAPADFFLPPEDIEFMSYDMDMFDINGLEEGLDD